MPSRSFQASRRFRTVARRWGPGLWILSLGLLFRPAVAGDVNLADLAASWRAQLTAHILPYWYNTAVDWERSGYLLADDGAVHRGGATEKQIVTQARMVWGFSLAHRLGFSSAKRDYLKAADVGYRFLLDHFRDQQNGGYFWSTDLEGHPRNDRKNLYGEAFVIYAFVEYFRGGGEQPALAHALDLYRTLQRHTHDAAHGGWGEHYTRDWRLVTGQDDQVVVELAGKKSAHANLHCMEALTELYLAPRAPEVRRSLEEALRLNATWFYPPDPAQAAFHREFDGRRVTGGRSDGLSYGHNVEFAWLMLRAQKALGQPRSWGRFETYLNHALRCAADPEHGGIAYTGKGDESATNRDKGWGSQAEWNAALTTAPQPRAHPASPAALVHTLRLIARPE